VILSYNISFETLVGTFDHDTVGQHYSDPQKYSCIEISDDEAYKHEEKRTFAVYDRNTEGMLYKLARLYTDRRAQYKTAMAQAKSAPEKTKYN